MEFSGARTAFAEGIDMTRRGGRYVTVGQVVPYEVPVSAHKITIGQLSVLGAFSGSGPGTSRAMQFLSRTEPGSTLIRCCPGATRSIRRRPLWSG